MINPQIPQMAVMDRGIPGLWRQRKISCFVVNKTPIDPVSDAEVSIVSDQSLSSV
jgi:hypothetical protein